MTIQTNLWGRFFNRPLLTTELRAAEVAAYLAHRGGVGGIIVGPEVSGDVDAIQAASLAKYGVKRKASFPSDHDSDRLGAGLYTNFEGVAIIPVVGSLVQRLGCLSYSGMVGYDAIREAIGCAIDDDNVAGVFIEEDTPGGEVSGLFDLADFIREMRAIKPIWAHANDMSCSAGYALGSQASVFTATQTAQVGSIGAICVHTDISRAAEKAGITFTVIADGPHKADGNSYGPLPPEVLADLQAQIASLRVLFAEKVALGRPSLSVEAILATESRVYGPGDALSLGLIDGIMPLDAAIAAFASQLAGSLPAANMQGKTMSQKAKAPTPAAMAAGLRAAGILPKHKAEAEPKTPAPAEPGAEDTEDDDTEAAVGPASEPDSDEGETDETDDEDKPVPPAPPKEDAAARSAERERIAAIMGAPEAAGREGLAAHYAFKTSATYAEAVAALKAAPKATSGGSLAAAMAETPNVIVGAGAPPAPSASLAVLQRGAELRFGKKESK